MSLVEIKTGYMNPFAEKKAADKVLAALEEIGPTDIFCPLSGQNCNDRCPAVHRPWITERGVHLGDVKKGFEKGGRCYQVNAWGCQAPILVGVIE